MYTHYNIFIHSSTDWHIDCFHFLGISNSFGLNEGMQMSLQNIDFFLRGWESRSNNEIAGFHYRLIIFLNSFFLLIIMYHITFYQKYARIPFFPNLHPLGIGHSKLNKIKSDFDMICIFLMFGSTEHFKTNLLVIHIPAFEIYLLLSIVSLLN